MTKFKNDAVFEKRSQKRFFWCQIAFAASDVETVSTSLAGKLIFGFERNI